MQEFDPRARTLRYAPKILLGMAGCAAVAGGWMAIAHAMKPPAPPPLDPAQAAALQHAAFTQAEAQAGFARPESVRLKILPGETFESAVRRAGVAADEADEAVGALGRIMDTVHIKAGMAFEAAVAKPRSRRGPARLVGLSLRTSPTSAITLSRTFDGAVRVRELEEKVTHKTVVAEGSIDGSLYQSALDLGATPSHVAEMSKLFSHKVDIREVQPGDKFTMVFDCDVTESGRKVGCGALDHVEFKGVEFYRFERDNGDSEYFDETGKNIKGFLLRTPVDGARMTSSFGMRRHPILGYNRMHQGIDFGAGSGTPVLAAGDGVVVEARRWGGYGNWLRIRHNGGWETGYGHLSRYAKGLRAGQKIRQGQVVAYVGSTGASTGPHLHYEVWMKGKRINPVGAKVPQGTVLAGAELGRFKAERARIDSQVAAARGDTSRAYAQADLPGGLRR
jgi:murein DD-endopeptidase MepM/ murein hydrolase activator NlpD